MNSKEKELRSLTWKYFWKRKREETLDFVKENWILLVAFIWAIAMSYSIYYTVRVDINSMIFPIVFMSPFVIGAFLFIVHLIYEISKDFILWIQLNWEWATEDARQELNKRSRRTKSDRSPSQVKGGKK